MNSKTIDPEKAFLVILVTGLALLHFGLKGFLVAVFICLLFLS